MKKSEFKYLESILRISELKALRKPTKKEIKELNKLCSQIQKYESMEDKIK